MGAKRTLPAETTSFVGRETDLLHVEEAFAAGARLVTLVGPPGMGKSRLGLRAAARYQAAARFADGVVACELVDATTAEDLCAALGRALDVQVGREQRGARVVAWLAEHLGDVLVLLDNAELIAPVSPETIGRWLTLAPGARFLVTSRERLRLAGEVVHELGPLSLPDEGAGVDRSEAAQLFVERARTVRPHFAVTADNAETIAEIVRQLDGIPLAIELGATRMGVVSPAKLLERLPRRLDLLSAPIRNPAARQRTLREAIDASFAMLSPHEQDALAQASVFRGGFGVDAAEAVIDLRGAGDAASAPAVIDVLQALLDRSLLFTRSPAGSSGEVRFGMYLSIRDHAWERLEASGRAGEALERHAAHYLAAIADAKTELDGAAELARARWVAEETPNLVAVHRHLLAEAAKERAAAGDRPASEGLDRAAAKAAGALRAALALGLALGRWGPVSNLRAMLDDALAAGGEAIPAELRLRGLLAKGNACRSLGRTRESLADHEAAFALAERTGDERTKAIAAAGIGMAIRGLGRLPEARMWLDSALPGLHASGARRIEVQARTILERIHTVLGHGDEARAQRRAVLRLLGEERDAELLATSHASAAMLAIAEGRLSDAELDLDLAAAELREVSSPGLSALALSTRALLLQEQGRLAEARASAESAIALGRRLGDGRVEGYSLGQLGTVLAEMGDLVEARAALARASSLLGSIGDARAASAFTAALAAVTARLGHTAEAERLLAALAEPLAEVADPMLSAAIDVYRAVLSPEHAQHAFASTRDIAARSHHVRTALRILAASLPEEEAGLPPPDAPETSGRRPTPRPSRALVVSPDGRWCRLPDGREVSFRRGRALRLMLARLVAERLESPGRAIPLAALFESGWPGEKAAGDARENRVYVGLSRLRKLGFAGLVVSRDDGFLLDPAVPAYLADPPAAG
jgi:predicted ATPase